VECKTLDLWRREQGGEDVHLLKIDVEGHEMPLLRGAPETLAATRHLYIEVKQTHLPEFKALTAGAGYVVDLQQDLPTGDSMLLLERRSDPVPNP
jgi:hypothetical protein